MVIYTYIHNVRELRIPKLRQEPGLWGWFIPQGESSKITPWKTQRAMARNWVLSNLDSLYTHIHTHIYIYIYIHRHIKLMRHGRFSGQHDFRSPWYQIHMTIHDHTWPCHHGKEQPPRRWKAPGFWFSDVSSVWKAPTGSPRNFRQVKVKTPWIFQEFERLQMGFSENRAARNSNGLPSFSLLKKIAYFYGYPIYFQTNPNSTNGIVWCGNRPNLWVPAFE